MAWFCAGVISYFALMSFLKSKADSTSFLSNIRPRQCAGTRTICTTACWDQSIKRLLLLNLKLQAAAGLWTSMWQAQLWEMLLPCAGFYPSLFWLVYYMFLKAGDLSESWKHHMLPRRWQEYTRVIINIVDHHINSGRGQGVVCRVSMLEKSGVH